MIRYVWKPVRNNARLVVSRSVNYKVVLNIILSDFGVIIIVALVCNAVAVLELASESGWEKDLEVETLGKFLNENDGEKEI